MPFMYLESDKKAVEFLQESDFAELAKLDREGVLVSIDAFSYDDNCKDWAKTEAEKKYSGGGLCA